METEVNVLKSYYLPVILGTLMFSMILGFFIVAILQYRRTRKVLYYERELFNNALLQTQLEIRDYTLNQVSRDLHDNIGQLASIIKINLNSLEFENLTPNDKLKIQETQDLIKNLITEIKSVSKTLNSENIKNFGYLESVLKDIQRINKTGHISIIHNIHSEIPKLNADVEVFLYRMTQEIFNNILQHSKAKNAEIDVVKKNKKLTIEISDDGVGFNIAQLSNPIKTQPGLGLTNLEERAKLINSEIKIDSVIGKGTRITIIVPV